MGTQKPFIAVKQFQPLFAITCNKTKLWTGLKLRRGIIITCRTCQWCVPYGNGYCDRSVPITCFYNLAPPLLMLCGWGVKAHMSRIGNYMISRVVSALEGWTIQCDTIPRLLAYLLLTGLRIVICRQLFVRNLQQCQRDDDDHVDDMKYTVQHLASCLK